MKKIMLSIIIPCYNNEFYIKRLIDSIGVQKYKDELEVIFVDDGSIDLSSIKFEKYSKRYNLNNKLIKQVNSGVSKARNIGIEYAIGEYIYFLDSDDFISSNFMEVINNLVCNKDFDICFFGFRNLDNKYIRNKDLGIKDNIYVLKSLLNRTLKYNMCSFVVRNRIIKENNLKFNSFCSFGEDNEFIVKCLVNSRRILLVKEVLFYYCNNISSSSKSYTIERINSLKAAARTEKYILENTKISNKVLKKYIVDKITYNISEFYKYGNKEIKKDLKEFILNNYVSISEKKCIRIILINFLFISIRSKLILKKIIR